MHKYKKIYELKCICKEQARQIKEYRIEYRKLKKDHTLWNDPKWTELSKKYPEADSNKYRCYHIAHCLLRGKLYEQIENKVHEQNKLSAYDWDQIENVRKAYYEEVEHLNATDALEVV